MIFIYFKYSGFWGFGVLGFVVVVAVVVVVVVVVVKLVATKVLVEYFRLPDFIDLTVGIYLFVFLHPFCLKVYLDLNRIM